MTIGIISLILIDIISLILISCVSSSNVSLDYGHVETF